MSKGFLLVVISLVTVMMVTAGSFHLVLADPLHCDIEGWPSCYSVGYSNGLANPGTSCPSGHSDNYCTGWDAGARMENTQTTLPEGCGPGYDNSTCGSSTSSSQLSLHDQICNAYHNDAVKALAALPPRRFLR
ncbi:MAG: hypothetical protein WAK17_18020 [Candidatus Nitrosopolaris sp.]